MKVSVEDVLEDENFLRLVQEYEDETVPFKDFPKADPNKEQYISLEKAGLLTTFAVYVKKVLVGFACVLTTSIPHYKDPFCVVESIFLDKNHRATGLGKKLIEKIENHARDTGIKCLLITSPIGGGLYNLLSPSAYTAKSCTFYLRIKSKKNKKVTKS